MIFSISGLFLDLKPMLVSAFCFPFSALNRMPISALSLQVSGSILHPGF